MMREIYLRKLIKVMIDSFDQSLDFSIDEVSSEMDSIIVNGKGGCFHKCSHRRKV